MLYLNGKTLAHGCCNRHSRCFTIYNYNFTTTAFQYNYMTNNQLTKTSSFTSSLQSLISPVFFVNQPHICLSKAHAPPPKKCPLS